MSQNPSVGRMVHYYPQDSDRFGEVGQPVAAVIVRVWTDERVNLKLFPDSDDQPWAASVPFDAELVPFSWSWPAGIYVT